MSIDTQRWEGERYVKILTRNTVGWKVLGWDAQNLLMQIARVATRAGLLKLDGCGPLGVAIALDQGERFEDRIRRPLEKLLEHGTAVIKGDYLVIRNFPAIQEAKSTTAARQQKRREKLRDMVLLEKLDGPKPPRPKKGKKPVRSQNVTGKSRNVTKRHVRSRDVTPNLTVPSLEATGAPMSVAAVASAVEEVPPHVIPAAAAAAAADLSWLGALWPRVQRLRIERGRGTIPETIPREFAGFAQEFAEEMRGSVGPDADVLLLAIALAEHYLDSTSVFAKRHRHSLRVLFTPGPAWRIEWEAMQDKAATDRAQAEAATQDFEAREQQQRLLAEQLRRAAEAREAEQAAQAARRAVFVERRDAGPPPEALVAWEAILRDVKAKHPGTLPQLQRLRPFDVQNGRLLLIAENRFVHDWADAGCRSYLERAAGLPVELVDPGHFGEGFAA